MTNYEKLIKTLEEIFMLDKAELDFGIYRIMNQKRKDIEQFLRQDLVPQVKQVLAQSLSTDKVALQKELDDTIKTLTSLKVNPDENEKVQELKARLGEVGNIEGLENEVFSLLANFFKRYFDNGDFISMRRYKKDVYAIPYEGEEVKLHWANADQYYIKTSEYFKNYRFKLPSGKAVAFELVEASTEQNNNKAQGDKERKFALYADNPCAEMDGEFKIYFTYEPVDKKTKQEDLLKEAFDTVKDKIPAAYNELLSPRPTEKDKQRSLLQKHFTDYTARNTFDYFIHKDLGGFLRRELDFYIKNEVLFIDDLNTRDEQEFLKQLSKIKALKNIGEKIITFLAQLEDFQKKLWLKKKMVVQCDYCITLDRVPETLYEEIAANEAQRDEWVKLFAIDEIQPGKDDMFAGGSVGYSTPLTVHFLKQNPFLLVDTAFFSAEFKWKLIASIENFDEQCDGLLINSDNFQALTVMNNRYFGKVQALYIDPPYNTSASEIIYKNEFKSSSWNTLIENRLSVSKTLLNSNSIACVTIDDFEFTNLFYLCDYVFGQQNHLATVPIRNNPQGRSTVKGFAINHEYALFYSNTDNKKNVGRLERTDSQNNRYNETDENGQKFLWENFRKTGTDSNREDRPKQFYPLYFDGVRIRVPEMTWEQNKWIINEEPKESEKVFYPINEASIEKVWKWGNDRVKDNPSFVKVDIGEGNTLQVYRRNYLNEAGSLPSTWWDKSQYSATSHGTNLLTDLFGKNNSFSFPKSVYAVMDSLKVANLEAGKIALDYFAGSGTTGHAVINLNRQEEKQRRYILVEMGTYFDTVTKPRIQKVIYSKDWKDGKPVSREGISHCFKYMCLEGYEDTLNNLELKRSEAQELALSQNSSFKEGYMLHYMLDIEAQDSLLNLDSFIDPFNYYLNITRNNETIATKCDMVETFNYLIGLVVESYAAPKEGFVVVTGTTNITKEKVLVVWRDCTKHDRAALNQFLEKSKYNPLDAEFDVIYVNGDNNVENLKTGDERWKVTLIEEEFKMKMFEAQ